MSEYDAVVVGAGPNGLSAAITLARAGCSVLLLEANPTIGGAARSAEITLPGFVSGVFSSVYPLGIGSPFLSQLPLGEHGLEWVQPEVPVAHPLPDGSVALLERSLDTTVERMGAEGESYRDLVGPLVKDWDVLLPELLRPFHLPGHPFRMARFGLKGLRSAQAVCEKRLSGPHARALMAGCTAHVGIPLDFAATASYGMVLLGSGHAAGWPFAGGGAGRLTDALASYFRSLGGEIRTDTPVRSLSELPPARAILLNLTPKQVVRVAGDRLPDRYRRELERFRYGVGVFKLDWALDGPIPWTAEECHRAGTVHVAGTYEEVIESERHPYRGTLAERPFVLLGQPSLFDPLRAPPGKHVAWAYCHVPLESPVDMTERMEAQIERFAPGFRERILARHVLRPADLEALDANLIGGDINGGAGILPQLFTRPVARRDPYTTPVDGLYICSASTPPSGGVHGMCGHNAALSALKRM
jgi:phytoene dehydrogenase-like protein